MNLLSPQGKENAVRISEWRQLRAEISERKEKLTCFMSFQTLRIFFTCYFKMTTVLWRGIQKKQKQSEQPTEETKAEDIITSTNIFLTWRRLEIIANDLWTQRKLTVTLKMLVTVSGSALEGVSESGKHRRVAEDDSHSNQPPTDPSNHTSFYSLILSFTFPLRWVDPSIKHQSI